MAALLGESEAQRLLETLSQRAPQTVRYNRGQCSLADLEGKTVPWNEPFGRCWENDVLPSRTIGYAWGQYYIQEAAAMLAIAAAAKVIDFADKIVLDLTAAPGGKATQAAELITTGYLAANEAIKKRVAALTWNINRHRLNNVIVTALPTRLLAESLPGFFDIVIVDAPCSGEGLFQKGKHSLAKWSEQDVLFCARRQRTILQDAVRLVRSGGFLVYSTCTFAREENEDQVEYLFKLGLSPAPLPADLPVSRAITENENTALCSRRIFPHRDGGAGAFVAVLQKTAGLECKEPLKYAYHETDKIRVKAEIPILQGDRLPGFFYEKKGIVSYFSHERIPSFLLQNSFQIGAPIINKLKDNESMFGSIQLAVPGAAAEIDRQAAESYICGDDIPLDLADGCYFVSFQGKILGTVKVCGGRGINKFPAALRKKEIKSPAGVPVRE